MRIRTVSCFFPGSAPLYRNGVLVGGLGVSGDGVDQDDFVTAAGAAAFRAPAGMRADQICFPRQEIAVLEISPESDLLNGMRLLLTAMLLISAQRRPARIPRNVFHARLQARPARSRCPCGWRAGLGLGERREALRSPDGRTVEGVTGGEGVFRVRDLAPGFIRFSCRAKVRGMSNERSAIEARTDRGYRRNDDRRPQAAADANALPHAQTPAEPGYAIVALSRNRARRTRPTEPGSDSGGTARRDTAGRRKSFRPRAGSLEIPVSADARYRKGIGTIRSIRNRLKGDYPIFGNRTFLNLNFVSTTFVDARQLPTPSNVPSERPGSSAFFGKYAQLFLSQKFAFHRGAFSRRHFVSSTGLADQDHAGRECQLPGHARTGHRECRSDGRRRALRHAPRAAGSVRRSENRRSEHQL